MANQSSIMPSLGRTVPNCVRIIAGSALTGWRDVDYSAEFMAGMVAALVMKNNAIVVTPYSGEADSVVIGLFNCHKSTYFYQPVVKDAKTFDADGKIYTKPNILDGSLVVAKEDGTPYAVTSNYTVNLVNGIITNVNITGTVYLSYRYRDPNEGGIDQTLSGKASVIEGNGDVGTLVYSTACSWELGDVVYAGEDGLLTTDSGDDSLPVVGVVTKPPTPDNIELQIKMRL